MLATKCFLKAAHSRLLGHGLELNITLAFETFAKNLVRVRWSDFKKKRVAQDLRSDLCGHSWFFSNSMRSEVGGC